MNSFSASFSFPTFSKKATKNVSIKDGQDMDELKKKDPFLYYSVPQVREAAVLFKEKEYSLPEVQEVKRQTRISFETRDLFLEDFLVHETKSLGLDESDVSEDAQTEGGDDLLDMFFCMAQEVRGSRKRKEPSAEAKQ
jgi:hypothetical protein